MTGHLHVYTTVDSADAAESLARDILGARLAACVQIIGPVRSLSWREGVLDDAQEWQLLITTPAADYPALEAHIGVSHGYATPEIVATEIVAGSAAYLRWLDAPDQGLSQR
ncbi:divalent-cation tolerance protein CutA [Nonomuraea endophytica]|uniref:Periplasmic divalent cation tolerance protein n=1 Tax=Nonomuraea endophytica TaxID=714136 RepID=A0A7W8EL35_9ACTN|nr:divalent-cation tolerance protein CutA [Nonomuraea endophytica]MBB5082452.1 periplasmic divalent cation tolerance protein [Nonomuraea endophytica]